MGPEFGKRHQLPSPTAAFRAQSRCIELSATTNTALRKEVDSFRGRRNPSGIRSIKTRRQDLLLPDAFGVPARPVVIRGFGLNRLRGSSEATRPC
jgi:hypothetical protein